MSKECFDNRAPHSRLQFLLEGLVTVVAAIFGYFVIYDVRLSLETAHAVNTHLQRHWIVSGEGEFPDRF